MKPRWNGDLRQLRGSVRVIIEACRDGVVRHNECPEVIFCPHFWEYALDKCMVRVGVKTADRVYLSGRFTENVWAVSNFRFQWAEDQYSGVRLHLASHIRRF